jgi:hypothetical protein
MERWSVEHRAFVVETYFKMYFKVYKILKQISKDIKETARIQGNIDENVFLRYYDKLWNTTNINELQLEYNSTDHLQA